MRDGQAQYIGKKMGETCVVEVVEANGSSFLPLRTDLRNHSPDGFQWGYNGSGPSQLALAMLADATDDEHAVKNYFMFKTAVIARLADEWSINVKAVREMTGWKRP